MKFRDMKAYIQNAKSVSFIIGAGASKSAGIPLASEIIQIAEEKYSYCFEGMSEAKRSNYGRVMAALSPQERRDIIEPLLNGATLNWGHVALASIAKEPNVKRILTFNFDFLLEKAIGLLGYHLPVYDFGIAPASNISGLSDKAIFHLHGQSYGIKLLNSNKETTRHSRNIRPIVSDTLCNHVTIICGYSGGADGAFKMMLDSYNGENRLFWLGHSEYASKYIAPLFRNNFAVFIGGCDFDQSMIEIARWLNCWPLPIIENPPHYVRQLLVSLPPFPLGEENETAVLHQTRINLEKISLEWERGRSSEEREASALMSGVNIDENRDLTDYSIKAIEIRSWRILSAADKLMEDSESLSGEARERLFHLANEKYSEAVRLNPNMHEAFNNWGNALIEEAMTLGEDARTQKLKEAGDKYAEAVGINPNKHESFFNWGNALGKQSKGLKSDERIKMLTSAGEKYQEAVRIKPDKFEAFNNWGNALIDEAELLDGSEKRVKLEEASEKYSVAVSINPEMHSAYANWGNALIQLSKTVSGEDHLRYIKEAREKYAEAVRINPGKHETLNNWGASLIDEARMLDGDARNNKIIDALARVQGAKNISGLANYNFACLHSMLGNSDKALEELEACRLQGTLPEESHILKDPDLASLRGHPRFAALFGSSEAS